MTRRAYVDTSAGQMHVREAGDGAAIVLLHWFPLSARMYEAELPVFAELGWRAIAPDTMGLGNSDPREKGWTVEQHADSFAEALAALDVKTPVILGGHMASQFAVELASRADVGARAVVLDGGPFVEEAALKEVMAKMGRVKGGMTPQEDGSHKSFLWNMAANTYDIFAPGFEATDETLPILYTQISDYISAYLLNGGAVQTDTPPYQMKENMAALRQPGVLLTADTEPLRTSFEPMMDAYDGPLESHIFPGDHPLHDPARAGEYARAIDKALSTLGIKSV